MNEIKTVWHWWWGWNPEKIEDWLEEIELEGWNLFQVDFNHIRFKFEKGESRKMRYCVDYQEDVDENYFELFKEYGWELADDGILPWYIWRKSYENERPSIYTDTISLIERNNRQLWIVGILIVMDTIVFYSTFNGGYIGIGLGLLFLMILVLGYIMMQLYRYNKKLEKNEMKL